MKSQTPELAFFAAQFASLLVGPGKMFTTVDDLCRWAANEVGITGISLPTGMLNVRRMIHDKEHREETVEHYRNLGTRITRLESHVTGQQVCMHPAITCRFRGFAPRAFQHLSQYDLENRARTDMLEAIELSRLLGFTEHQTFPGGRSVPVATDPWNAYPPLLREKALAILAEKWEPILAAAGKAGVRVGFEIRHIMEDLCDVSDLLLFRRLLYSDDARRALAWGVDISHYEIDGDSPIHDLDLAIKEGLAIPGHAKQGIFDDEMPGHNRRPANKPWDKRAGQFCTFGTFNPLHAKALGQMLQDQHAKSETGIFAVIEGECMFLKNPAQGVKVAAGNLRRVFKGEDPIPFNEISPEEWDGPEFDKFADSGYTAEEVMALSADEVSGVTERLEKAGII